ncbi:MAG TPA: hypothetical protein VML35_10330 [Gaiellaceae bacterium]|nr:hypothetical protein [Gaiellaceae bacterium]
MKRIALLAAVALLAACGGSVDESAPPPAAAPGLPVRVSEPPAPAEAIRAADGSASFAVRGGTLLRFDPATGRRTSAIDLGGAWKLGGVSATGRWVGLTRPGTKVLVVDAERGVAAHELSLPGRFVVETISAAGDFLFLQQDFVDGSYAVRGFDLAAGKLLPGSLGTKGETVRMQGAAGQVVASRDGRWLLTVYVETRTNSAFVHALDLVAREPRCIPLPPCERCSAADWTLALAPDGNTLRAANAGRKALIDLGSGRLVS